MGSADNDDVDNELVVGWDGVGVQLPFTITFSTKKVINASTSLAGLFDTISAARTPNAICFAMHIFPFCQYWCSVRYARHQH